MKIKSATFTINGKENAFTAVTAYDGMYNGIRSGVMHERDGVVSVAFGINIPESQEEAESILHNVIWHEREDCIPIEKKAE